MANSENGIELPLSEFWRFVGDFTSITSWTAKLAVSAPFIDLLVKVGPPWPSRVSVSALAAIAEVVVLLVTFEFWRHGRKTYAYLRSMMRRFLLIGIAALVAYTASFGSFVKEVDDYGQRSVIGFRMLPHIKELWKEDPSRWTAKELVQEFHDEEAIWYPWSINVARLIVALTWLTTWICLACVISAFVTAQWKRMPRIRSDAGR
jgi:hypothetical protein